MEGGAFGGLIGSCPAMRRAFALAAELSRGQGPVLLRGEPGTGKASLARAIAQAGAKGAPLVELHCSATPEALFVAELFGFRGIKPGQSEEREIGLFDRASGGALLLYGLEYLPLEAQEALLAALTQQPPPGDPWAVRVLSTEPGRISAEVGQGRFLGALLARLSESEIELPPLRERGADITALAEHFLEREARQLRKPLRLSDAARERLTRYSWPGNVRELEGLITRAAFLTPKGVIDAGDLPVWVDSPRRA
jgi:DNA-binding NtrC family response regulator